MIFWETNCSRKTLPQQPIKCVIGHDDADRDKPSRGRVQRVATFQKHIHGLTIGMRMRLTRDQDKERGFLNGGLGVKSTSWTNPLFWNLMRVCTFCSSPLPSTRRRSCHTLPTMRRVQGATLNAVALHFDRRRPDPGNTYVAASRVRAWDALWHIGRLRSSDWAPVGADPGQPSDDSISKDSEGEGYMSDISSGDACPDDEGDAFAIQVGIAADVGKA